MVCGLFAEMPDENNIFSLFYKFHERNEIFFSQKLHVNIIWPLRHTYV